MSCVGKAAGDIIHRCPRCHGQLGTDPYLIVMYPIRMGLLHLLGATQDHQVEGGAAQASEAGYIYVAQQRCFELSALAVNTLSHPASQHMRTGGL